jgi:hypothetical protein
VKNLVRMISDSEFTRQGCIALGYPRKPWYTENAPLMLHLLGDAAQRLEKALGVLMPTTSCYVVEPETALAIQGVTGAAYQTMIIVGIPPGHLSVLGGVGAHELAHILSRQLGDSSPPFKGEGFACYGAWKIQAQTMPTGVPLHFHLGWLLSVGVRPTLEELWERRDYTPELYDLAWSFAAFVAERFGQERYFDFYRSVRLCLRDRLEESLGVTTSELERDWHDHARRHVGPQAGRVRPRRRWDGCVCSRAAWLSQH